MTAHLPAHGWFSHLTEEQRTEALRLFEQEEKTVREIASALGCGVYDLSPYIYQRTVRRIREEQGSR